MNLFEFADCQDHLLEFDNFYILALDAKVVQLLNGVIRVGASTGDLIE